MPANLENLSLADACLILDSFGLSGKPYQVERLFSSSIAVYYRQITSLDELNLPLDILQYFYEVFRLKQQNPELSIDAHRRVAFLWETRTQEKCALLVSYEELDNTKAMALIHNFPWKENSPTMLALTSLSDVRSLSDLYNAISIQGIFPEGFNDKIIPLATVLQQQINKTITIRGTLFHEPSGIRFIYNILSRLSARDHPISEPSLEDLFKEYRIKITANIIVGITTLKEKNNPLYQRLIQQLTILVKYANLQALDNLLHPFFNKESHDAILAQHEEYQKQAFALTFKSDADLLNHLAITGLCCLWRLREDPKQFCKKITAQNLEQYNKICQWERSVPEFKAQPLSWFQGAQKHLYSMIYYCYVRSDLFVGKVLFSWLAKQALVPNDSNKLYHLIMAYLGALFGLAFSVTLPKQHIVMRFGTLFLAENTHRYFKKEKIDKSQAQLISNESSIPSTENFMFMYLLLSYVALALYAEDDSHFKRMLFVLTAAKVINFLSLKCVDKYNVFGENLRNRSAFSLVMSLLGSSLGALLFFVYENITDKLAACEHVIAEIQSQDPSVNYLNIEPPDILTHPTRWFNSENPFRFRFGNKTHTYQADCEGVSAKELTCNTKELPKMLTFHQ